MLQEDTNTSDSDEEPSPEALARYLAMRRHTVGVGDSRLDMPEDVRVKLAQHQPIIAMPQPNMFMPLNLTPNLALNPAPPMMDLQYYYLAHGDQHHLQLPRLPGPGTLYIVF